MEGAFVRGVGIRAQSRGATRLSDESRAAILGHLRHQTHDAFRRSWNAVKESAIKTVVDRLPHFDPAAVRNLADILRGIGPELTGDRSFSVPAHLAGAAKTEPMPEFLANLRTWISTVQTNMQDKVSKLGKIMDTLPEFQIKKINSNPSAIKDVLNVDVSTDVARIIDSCVVQLYTHFSIEAKGSDSRPIENVSKRPAHPPAGGEGVIVLDPGLDFGRFLPTQVAVDEIDDVDGSAGKVDVVPVLGASSTARDTFSTISDTDDIDSGASTATSVTARWSTDSDSDEWPPKGSGLSRGNPLDKFIFNPPKSDGEASRQSKQIFGEYIGNIKLPSGSSSKGYAVLRTYWRIVGDALKVRAGISIPGREALRPAGAEDEVKPELMEMMRYLPAYGGKGAAAEDARDNNIAASACWKAYEKDGTIGLSPQGFGEKLAAQFIKALDALSPTGFRNFLLEIAAAKGAAKFR